MTHILVADPDWEPQLPMSKVCLCHVMYVVNL